MINRARLFYEKRLSCNDFEALKSLYITNFLSPILEVKKENLPFDWYRLEIFTDSEEYAMVSNYFENNGVITIKIKETPLIKFIREKYIKELILCCNDKKEETHYKKEILDVIDEYNLDYYLGNAIKHILDDKDASKAKEYLELYLRRKK